ncbi:MAG TPA: hypothetical protein VF179_17340 [Thermoanaerobaculia bacterium]|nr:hypothetical protein [Thermoanaerobaculia bacterium]
MRHSKVYSGKINSWDVLVSSLLARLAEWPFLEPLYNELLALVADLRVLVLQQEAARAQFHEAIGRRQEMERRGVELRTRIAAHLKAQLGFRNDQLRQFGLNPLPRATGRKIEEVPLPEITAPSDVEAEVEAD